MAIDIQILERSGRIRMPDSFDFKLHRDFKAAYMPMLDNPAVREIEIELSKVEFIDSSALGMLMLLNERAKAVSKTISLLNPASEALKMLKFANFDKIFNIK